jgi:hypothetical protein
MPAVVSYWCILTGTTAEAHLSTEITIGALVGKSSHYLLTWDDFESKPLIDLFKYYQVNQYLPEKKTGPSRRTVMLAFKFDVSVHDTEPNDGVNAEAGSNP